MEKTRKAIKAYADYCTEYNIIYQHPGEISLEKHGDKTYFILRNVTGILTVIEGDTDELRCLDSDDWPETIKNNY
jgi:hypothetical protein